MRTPHRIRAGLIAATALAAVVGLALAGPAEARSATTFYVSPTGSDSASGTQSQPWRSVDRVSRAALQPGDQVLFKRGGTYSDVSLSRTRPTSRRRPVSVPCPCSA